MNKKAYKFDYFYLEPGRRKLLHKGNPVQLSPKAFEILLLLIQRPGETVKKAEFLQKIWFDSFVEESNLAIHVSALRRILGEKRGERKFIETIKGQGYCFVCSVEEIEACAKKPFADALYSADEEKSGLATSETAHPAAHKAYLKGEFVFDRLATSSDRKESLYGALKFFKEAVKKDPNFARAYVGIGTVYQSLYKHNFLPRAEAHSESKTALQLSLNSNKNLSEAYVLQGINEIWFDRNLAAAENSFKRAIELNANDSTAYHYLSLVSGCLRKFREAILYQNKALDINPTSIMLNTGLIHRFYLAENYNRAIVHAEETLELDGRCASAHFWLAVLFAQLGMGEQALKNSLKALDSQPTKETILFQGYIHALLGNKTEATGILNRVLDKSNQNNLDLMDIAAVYSALEETEKALACIEKSFAEENSNVCLLIGEPRFNCLRGDSRFDSLLRKLNLP